MSIFKIGECRVCGKNCLWFTPTDGVLAVFDVCSEECLANCEEAQQILSIGEGEKNENPQP